MGVGIWALGYDGGRDELWGAINDKFNQYILGDLNSDNYVNVLDVLIVINMLLEITPIDLSADFNNDGVVNIIDAVTLVNIILGR